MFTARLPFWSTEKRKVATNIISYKRYREILFQKVALCYLLHFVQDGSSKSALENWFLRKHVNKNEHWGNKIPINPPSLEGPYLPLRRALFASPDSNLARPQVWYMCVCALTLKGSWSAQQFPSPLAQSVPERVWAVVRVAQRGGQARL